MSVASRIEVDLSALAANVRVVRGVVASRAGVVGGSGRPAPAAAPSLCAVLKADGYSLGAARLAKRLSTCGVDLFAVYTPEQARGIIDAAVSTPVLMLMPVHELDRSDALYRAASRGMLHFSIHDALTLSSLEGISDKLGMPISVHLDVDTGMSRGGAHPGEALALVKRIAAHPRISLAGVFNHFASADASEEFTLAQSQLFSKWLAVAAPYIPTECFVHEANSFGVFRARGFHRSMVRVGLALLGMAQEEFRDPDHFEFAPEAGELTPVMRWMSRLVHVKRIDAGTPVGYGSTWRAARDSRIGLVPVGYADGYPLACSNNAMVGVRLASGLQAFVPVVGRVSMDQITIDLTDVPEDQVQVGTVVEIIGNDRTAPNHLPTVAKRAGTIAHELLCRISARLPRQYVSMEQPVRDAASVSTAIANANGSNAAAIAV